MAASPSIKDLNKSPYHLLRKAWQYAGDLYSEQVGPDGLTHRQFTVLLAVEQNEGASQTDLVRITGIDRSTLADLVGRMIKKGLLQRRRTREDQRTNAVRLSAAGRRALESVQPAAALTDRKLLSALPAAKRREFVSALSIIANAMEESRQPKTDGKAAKPASRQPSASRTRTTRSRSQTTTATAAARKEETAT